jgi:hypothetical protein
MNTSDGRHNKTVNTKGEKDSCYALACQAHYLRATRLEVEVNCLLGFKSPVNASVSLIHSSGAIKEGLNFQSNAYFERRKHFIVNEVLL